MFADENELLRMTLVLLSLTLMVIVIVFLKL